MLIFHFLDDSRLCSGVRCFDTAVCMCCYLICHMADNCPKQPKKAATYKERKSRNMKKKEVLLRLGAMAMIAALGIAPATSGISAMAATSTASTNNTATKNDLTNADIVDESRTGSITIKKYVLFWEICRLPVICHN
ncbi:hypothetical protein LG34_10840 [Eubacterium ramulus]|uniref:Uncharacterized protein n=1 Tax=Eubacterium ramulus TaxID=39490 RepID=A0A2V1JNA3_EUBRA|nr:hypothetical protein [Eubacterium ramulus]PWE86310.1 hypothetical protein LG34_10840 [Eubacterium ramulus]